MAHYIALAAIAAARLYGRYIVADFPDITVPNKEDK